MPFALVTLSLFFLLCSRFALSLPVTLAQSPDDSSLSPRISLSASRNDLVNGACKDVTVIFARGTMEPGNVGIFAGPPLFVALEILIGSAKLAVQGVDYPATIEGYFKGGDASGSAKLASLVNLAATKCPNTQIVLSGYSQGAQVVHRSFKDTESKIFTPMASSSIERIAALVLFGDPDDNQSIPGIPASNIETICAKGDLICDGLPLPGPAHISYAGDAINAAKFLLGKLRL